MIDISTTMSTPLSPRITDNGLQKHCANLHAADSLPPSKKRRLSDEEPLEAPSPVDVARSMFPNVEQGLRTKPSYSISDTDLDGYTMEKVTAIRNKDVAKLRSMLTDDAASFKACNRNGETLLHLACRRGGVHVVKFLIDEAGVSPNVVDGLGRSVLHDVCWKSTADVALMKILISRISPELLVAEDIRGHTPFDYARREHWAEWNVFLVESKDCIRSRLEPDSDALYVIA
jgi:ankyrin repeat protein